MLNLSLFRDHTVYMKDMKAELVNKILWVTVHVDDGSGYFTFFEDYS